MHCYRERVTPPLWGFLLTALLIPASLIIFLPINPQLGWVFAVILVGASCLGLFFAAPTVIVENGTLRAGRASIPVSELGECSALTGDAAKHALGIGFEPSAYHSTSAWQRKLVMAEVIDEHDPAPYWLISTKRPDRLLAAIEANRQSSAERRS
ncbi:MAG TPA: DUF3093 domain-containing protein [Candidatus Agrococcus pullicola]|uniref:DUF3093 domain-containing protein n=1 Tax=Candidatus Agrococcus pullicola TaxID=2838429 RepID=A0A9D2C8Y4_9MICO|nr:DUF3093 domain-containing protein [Candidatus Agrococcus pullicola]